MIPLKSRKSTFFFKNLRYNYFNLKTPFIVLKKLQIFVFLCLFTTVLHANDTIPSLKKWVIKKGHQHANHLLGERFLSKPEILRWQVRLDSNARYILRDKNGKIDEDQFDWLKLHGITFTPLHPMHNTAMIGWRYNVEKDSFELNAYFHQQGKRFFDENFICVAPNEVFNTEIRLNYATRKIIISIRTARGNLSATYQYHYKRFPNRAFFIHPFFGGTSKAPHRIVIYSRCIKRIKFKKFYP